MVALNLPGNTHEVFLGNSARNSRVRDIIEKISSKFFDILVIRIMRGIPRYFICSISVILKERWKRAI